MRNADADSRGFTGTWMASISTRTHDLLHFIERARQIRRRAQPADPPGVPLHLHPGEVIAPGDEVVDLEQVDPTAEPVELSSEMGLPLRD